MSEDLKELINTIPTSQVKDVLYSVILFRYDEQELKKRIKWSVLMDQIRGDKNE